MSRKEWRQLNILHVLVDGLYDSIPVVLAFMAVYFASGERAVGLIMSLAMGAGTCACLGTIYCSRRLGMEGTVACIMLAFGCGFFINAFAGTMVLAGGCFVLAAAGHGVFHNLAFSHLTQHTDRALLGRTMSDFTAVGDIGRIPFASLAAFAAAASLFGQPGWRAVCLVYGLVGLGSGCLLLRRALRQGLFARECPDGERSSLLPDFSLLRSRSLACAVGASILDAFSGDMVFVFLPLLLFAKGIDPQIMGTFAFGFTLGCLVGKMACGRMADRFGNRRVFIAASLLKAVFLVALVLGDGLWVIMGAALMLGIMTKGTIPTLQTILVEPVSDRSGYDTVFSLNTFARGIVNILTPLAFGALAQARGTESIYALMAGGAALAVLPILFMRRGRRMFPFA